MHIVNVNSPHVFKDRNGMYICDSDICTDDELVIDIPGTLFVRGKIFADMDIEIRCCGLISNGGIYSNGHIKSMGNIDSIFGDIRAGRGIEACAHIMSKKNIVAIHGNIEAKSDIWAHESVHAARGEIQSMHGEIRADVGIIVSGACISAKAGIRSGSDILAGKNIVSGSNIYAERVISTPGKVIAGTFDREFNHIYCQRLMWATVGMGVLHESDIDTKCTLAAMFR